MHWEAENSRVFALRRPCCVPLLRVPIIPSAQLFPNIVLCAAVRVSESLSVTYLNFLRVGTTSCSSSLYPQHLKSTRARALWGQREETESSWIPWLQVQGAKSGLGSVNFPLLEESHGDLKMSEGDLSLRALKQLQQTPALGEYGLPWWFRR